MQTESELKKLTVPQLKALCKEKKISGYSKLGKDAIVQKLLGIATVPATAVVQTSTPASDSSSAIQNPSSPSEIPGPLTLTASSTRPLPPSNPVPDTGTKSISSPPTNAEPAPKPRPRKRKNPPAASQDSLPTSASQSHVFKVPAVPQRPSTISAPSVATSSAPTDGPAKKKKKATVPSSSSTNGVPLDTTIPPSTTPVAKKKKKATDKPVPSYSSNVAPLDAAIPPPIKKKQTALASNSVPLAIPTAAVAAPSTDSQAPVHAVASAVHPGTPTTNTPAPKLPPPKPKRFVPLVIRKPTVPVATATPATLGPVFSVAEASVDETLYHLDFPAPPPPPPLTAITLPPSLSKRKHVPRFSLLLSQVGDEDLRNCVLVSVSYEYLYLTCAAAYLSATHRLRRDFAGKRLTLVLEKHPPAITNMWPYLKQRTQELFSRKRQYSSSFLSRHFPSGASSPISEHLWTSPDHEKQIGIALRFLLTRLFFQVSVGGGGKDGKGWEQGQIADVQELVKDEVWTITVRHSPTSTESFYVLESTCEPLTAMPDSLSTGVPVRADWSAYIAHRAPPAIQNSPTPRLLDCLSWTNHEEYQLGISRLWLRRGEAEGPSGSTKRVVAERYILACVVANSLSGRYMSATQMAQDFAGLPDVALAPARIKPSPEVNLFLPAHHHVESVHFTTSGHALHGALAIVQTPGRIYFILRDNGMQVGCEEDGVAEVWMGILGCDNSGVGTARM
ncbi:hypothetical protein C8R47DRAFT_1292101 [Mycena vitilis]|nr:hypothetical protein C8R47DRAFT_1292101 [Mycena vitilis]